MRYALLARVDPDVAPAARPWGTPLHDPSDATTLRMADGRLQVTDGPFADEPEAVAGLDLVEADDLEAAADAAARHPAATIGAVEVREVWADFAPADPAGPDPVDPAPEAGRRYLFLHTNPSDRDPGTDGEPPTAWLEAEHTRRAVLDGNRLRPATPANAAVVRVRDGETVIAHGPYAELAEQVAGYDLVEVADLDEAIALARPHPTLAVGAIEIRPLWTS